MELVFGAPVDPFFHLPLWFCTELSGETLWAYNSDHLDFLAEHVGAKLRERNGFTFNVKSVGARLPRWMTAANNRDAVLKAIEKFQTCSKRLSENFLCFRCKKNTPLPSSQP